MDFFLVLGYFENYKITHGLNLIYQICIFQQVAFSEFNHQSCQLKNGGKEEVSIFTTPLFNEKFFQFSNCFIFQIYKANLVIILKNELKVLW